MEKKPQDSASRDADKYIVRFPDGMRERIAEAAKANNRSMNAEIVARLQASFASTAPDATAENLAEAWELLRSLHRRKDMLAVKVGAYQAEALQIAERIRMAMTDDSTTDDLQDLHVRRGRVYARLDAAQADLVKVIDELDAAYAKVKGQAPHGAVAFGEPEW